MASADDLQSQLVHALSQIAALSQEVKTVKGNVEFLNNDRIAKDTIINELKHSNTLLASMSGNNERSGGGDQIKLIDMKAMNPKNFDGKPESPFTAWAK